MVVIGGPGGAAFDDRELYERYGSVRKLAVHREGYGGINVVRAMYGNTWGPPHGEECKDPKRACWIGPHPPGWEPENGSYFTAVRGVRGDILGHDGVMRIDFKCSDGHWLSSHPGQFVSFVGDDASSVDGRARDQGYDQAPPGQVLAYIKGGAGALVHNVECYWGPIKEPST